MLNWPNNGEKNIEIKVKNEGTIKITFLKEPLRGKRKLNIEFYGIDGSRRSKTEIPSTSISDVMEAINRLIG